MLRAALISILGLIFGAPAYAASTIYADDLAKCVVAKTSDNDKQDLVVWMFAAMAVHPRLQALSKITDADRDAATTRAGALMQRLLTVDCHDQAVLALRYEGTKSMETAFGTLGEIAMGTIMAQPAVSAAFNGLSSKVDIPKITALLKEAGIQEKQ